MEWELIPTTVLGKFAFNELSLEQRVSSWMGAKAGYTASREKCPPCHNSKSKTELRNNTVNFTGRPYFAWKSSRASSVGIGTRLLTGRPRIPGSIRPLKSVQTSTATRQVPYSSSAGGSLNGEKATKVWDWPLTSSNSKYKLIYLLTPWSRVLEKLTGFQLVKKFPAFYETGRFITAFTTNACHLPLSWASSIQSILPHPTSWRSILILSSHLRLGLPSGSFPWVSPPKPCIRLFAIRATYSVHNAKH